MPPIPFEVVLGPFGVAALALWMYWEERKDRKAAETNLIANNETMRELVPLVKDIVQDVPQIIRDTVAEVLDEQVAPRSRSRRRTGS